VKPWTDEEKDWLTEEGHKMTVQAAARRLGRTNASVSGMMRSLGLVRVYPPKFWTPERNERLTEMYTTGAERRDICRSLNITIGALETQVTKLGLTRPCPRGPKEPRGPHCRVCYIGAEHMAGCPRPECRHYAEPMRPAERTLAGVGASMLVA